MPGGRYWGALVTAWVVMVTGLRAWKMFSRAPMFHIPPLISSTSPPRPLGCNENPLISTPGNEMSTFWGFHTKISVDLKNICWSSIICMKSRGEGCCYGLENLRFGEYIQNHGTSTLTTQLELTIKMSFYHGKKCQDYQRLFDWSSKHNLQRI